MLFDSFLSNEKNVAQIIHLCESGRLPHAILLEGERGSGRFLFARMIAAAAICRHKASGCGVCPDCRMALEGQHPDVEVYQKGGERTLAISSLREITGSAAIPPVQGRRRVIILRDIQDAAQIRTLNTLLKIIEEPPDYLMFIITADSRDHLLPTIVSRCTTMHISLPETDICAREAARLAEKAGSVVSTDDAIRCARLSSGNIGRCVSLLTDTPEAKAMTDALFISKRMMDVGGNGCYDVLLALRRYEQDRTGYRELLRCLQDLFSIAIREGVLPSEGTQITPKQCARILQALSLTLDEGQNNVNLSLALTRLCTRLFSAVNG